MNKETFMKELSKRIQHLKQEERMNILSYYAELIDDKIDTGINEKEAIDSLGTIDYIIFNLDDVRKANESEEFQSEIKNESKINIEPEVTYQSKPQTPPYVQPQVLPQVVQNNTKKAKRKVSWIKVVILILLAPAIFGILCGIVGALFGIAAGFIGVCVGVIALPIVGIYTMITSFYHMTISLYSGLLQFGAGLMLWSLGMAFFSIFKHLTKVVWNGGIKLIKSIWRVCKKQAVENGGNIIYE